jgi:hypothetical protein
MHGIIIALAVLNFVLSATRFLVCVRAKRLISVAWFLITYFSFFFIGVSLSGGFSHYRGFTGDTIIVTEGNIQKTIIFVAAFNCLFLCAEWSAAKLILPRRANWRGTQAKESAMEKRLLAMLGILLILGSALYAKTTAGHDYSQYISYAGSSWGQVFLWAGSPFIALLALRNRFIPALVACLPFLYFMMQMKVRSFALLSIVPLGILIFLKLTDSTGKNRARKVIKLLGLVGLILGASVLNSFVMKEKRHDPGAIYLLPDAGMPRGTAILMKAVDVTGASTQWDSLYLYIRNMVNPFVKLLRVPATTVEDPPVLMARLFDGVPKGSATFFHYPSLWYGDAYLAFRNWGAGMALLWGLVFVLWERAMSKGGLFLCLLLPYFTWHSYMLVRGAVAGATIPLTYSLYITLIVAGMAAIMGITSVVGPNFNRRIKATRKDATSDEDLSFKNLLS